MRRARYFWLGPTLLLGFILVGFTPAHAASLVGIVSERSAAEMAAGAHRFLDAHPEHRVQLRTVEQVAELDDAQLDAMLAQADALVLAAVFGDQVGRLVDRVGAAAKGRDFPILGINSDWRISRLSRLAGRSPLANLGNDQLKALVASPEPGTDTVADLDARRSQFPEQARWLTGRAYYQGRTPAHIDGLMRWLLAQAGTDIAFAAPEPRAAIRYYRKGEASADPAGLQLTAGPAVAILDLDSGDRPGDRALLDAVCQQLEDKGTQCFAVLSRWGGASLEAVRKLPQTAAPANLTAILSLQDFMVGGGEGRREVTEAFTDMGLPVLKGVRLADRTEAQWRQSVDGLPREAVHYQLAMPELQGISQPMVLAVAAPARIDERTGVSPRLSRPVPDRVEAMADRLLRWQRLRTLANADKKIALVYYNHPPGRQNVGADNLDVPASLFEMLHWLKAAGYTTGPLPESPEALHDLIQDRGVSLPQDLPALTQMKPRVPGLTGSQYQGYFETLPAVIRAELENGPLGYLHTRLTEAHGNRDTDAARDILARGRKDLRHLIEHLDHPARPRALALLDEYEALWQTQFREGGQDTALAKTLDALLATGFPGFNGWGEAPGQSMVVDGDMVFPGLRFGNVFLGPQPPRGWEIDEELLHANTTFPPTHQYVGFYHWLRDHFRADALVYLGRHSTREFLPRRRAGLTGDDYPDLLGGDLPLIYPYIVDGVGEGIQAKRRALAVMVSHLTPPLAVTELYDDLLDLRQLVETYEASLDPDGPTQRRAVAMLRQRIDELQLRNDFEREIALELGIAREDVSIDEISGDLLVHEAGHYVTDMQESFMPLGLHVLGRDWSGEAIDTMLASMAGKEGLPDPAWRGLLARSPAREREHFLAALAGQFVPPGQGNDPVRTPEVLPTGRNFHAISSDLIPTRVAWSLGQELAAKARQRDGQQGDDPGDEGSEALVLWASDTVRDEGVMIAFGLDMLGVTPVWNARGIVQGLEREPVGEGQVRSERRDLLFTTSGLFRDLYEDQLVLLDLAVRLALDGASETIRAQHPELSAALDQALAPLPAAMRSPGSEPLARNRVAQRWVADTRALLAAGHSGPEAGHQAALRVFGTAPGADGAGVNRLSTRTGAWEDRSALADAYRRRMGHAYGQSLAGEPAHDAFDARLAQVSRTYLGRASHLYGLLDNDDGFDFQGGLSTAVEHVRGEAPDNRVLQHADPRQPRVESLERALLTELRGRNLNPQWLQPLMQHGYAGARTMGSDFLDNLWGWQVTSPQVVKSWVWDEVNDTYFKDRHDIGLDEFLARGHNVHVKTHMQSMALLAAQRGYWQADPFTLRSLATDFAGEVVDHGLPGSGHTRPGHPLLDWVADRLDPELRTAFEARLDDRLPGMASPETCEGRQAC
ncbi:MAG: cobaltochelatase subunit CobN [Marinobacter sp.]|uniref:cobaltochelatase subunit CobN n=1 Tax=Marinobacter sp. TaxID=50741 RepID=UPI00299EF01F|nr:cobaltochelatase subunit CobN [Marinobacter sp.]MDX1635577.1 cobaltochelatase subunit CobN [Marinobacter sp.]